MLLKNKLQVNVKPSSEPTPEKILRQTVKRLYIFRDQYNEYLLCERISKPKEPINPRVKINL